MSLAGLSGEDARECLTELFCKRGVPEHVRSNNGADFTAKQVRKQLNELGAQTLSIEPGGVGRGMATSTRSMGRCATNCRIGGSPM